MNDVGVKGGMGEGDVEGMMVNEVEVNEVLVEFGVERVGDV